MAVSRPSFNASWQRWAGVRLSRESEVVVRLVTARSHRGLDRLEVGAALRVEQSGQPRHPVRPLGAEVQSAPAGTVLVAEQAVGIEVVGYALTKFRDDPGVDTGCVLDQCALGGFDVDR